MERGGRCGGGRERNCLSGWGGVGWGCAGAGTDGGGGGGQGSGGGEERRQGDRGRVGGGEGAGGGEGNVAMWGFRSSHAHRLGWRTGGGRQLRPHRRDGDHRRRFCRAGSSRPTRLLRRSGGGGREREVRIEGAAGSTTAIFLCARILSTGSMRWRRKLDIMLSSPMRVTPLRHWARQECSCCWSWSGWSRRLRRQGSALPKR